MDLYYFTDKHFKDTTFIDTHALTKAYFTDNLFTGKFIT